MLFCNFACKTLHLSFTEILQSYHLSILQWVAMGLAFFILGIAKAGIKGFGTIIVVILAFVFHEKASTGILLPMLVAGDIMAVTFYNRHAKWDYVWKLVPWMVGGVLVGVWIGNTISETVFKRLMAVIIIGSTVVMFITEIRKSKIIPESKWFARVSGFTAGFTTMVGNLAGPIANIYFLAMRFPKNEFIGTAAWVFFIINVFKLPFHVFVWHTIDTHSFMLNLVMLPVVVIGFLIGAQIVKRISNLSYRRFILVVTAIGGLVLLFR